jgi:glycosyltransferase involved in cell wall biosynthesis
MIKKRVVRLFSAGVGGGTPQQEYLQRLGIAPGRTFQGCTVVDNHYFAEAAAAARRSAASTRTSLGLPENFFLTIARFIPEKNLFGLLNAYACYRQEAGARAWKLVLLGDGPLKAQLLEERTRLGLDEDVLMPGFKQYSELPSYYGLAGAFVLPSVSETWGLVINEAMAAGLPVLVSEFCGCARDLVVAGKNGFTFHPHDTGGLARLMLQLSGGACDLAAMSRHSQELVGRWSPEALAETMCRAAIAARAAPPKPRMGWLDNALLQMLLAQRLRAGKPAVKD